MDLARIIKEYELSKITKEMIVKMFEYATSKELNFFKITTDKVDIDKKFSRNFLHYLDPDEFK
jgi:ribonucleotide reductase beta subunit family protein with ferritin-like domain